MGDNNTIKKVIDYIEENLDRKLNLDEVANHVGYSKFYLSRLFVANVGCTLYKYIQVRRLTVAAEKLVNTQKPILEIAFESNYDSQQAFTIAFKQIYLCTPQRYRMAGLHIPKLNRFIVDNRGMVVHSFATKHEVMAA